MNFTHRVIESVNDQLAMAALARATSAHNLHVIDLPYRLSSWALDEPANTQLWFAGDQLVAWAVLQPPFWAIDYVIHPAYETSLHPTILDWVEKRARAALLTPYGRPAWYINVFSTQTNRIAEFEQRGYQCQSDLGEDSWSKVLMRRVDPAPVKIYRPRTPGFTIRPLAGEAEVPAYVDLHQAVFGTPNMQVDWRQRTLRHPAYRPDLDIVVAAPDGRLAAFCIGWYDAELQAGQIEPLGCHADFRKFGLGRVALTEVMARLQALGAQTIYVETDNYRDIAFRLYQSVGFEVFQEVLVYKQVTPV